MALGGAPPECHSLGSPTPHAHSLPHCTIMCFRGGGGGGGGGWGGVLDHNV